ncbi:hypothetical protein XENOCAPTIV_026905 [Xenoophorus captivus]|uniref:Uncharacterized protein n=1 Tax=Xenoophorus captivus TaxID=1517983 RepID=A0ABV0RJ66_9TELE
MGGVRETEKKRPPPPRAERKCVHVRLFNTNTFGSQPFFSKLLQKQGCTVSHLVALLPCSKKVLGLMPGQGSFYMEFACSPCACVGSHRVLLLPLKVQRHAC